MADNPKTIQSCATVLVVEDSPTQLQELSFLLEESGFSVVTASNGKLGLAAARANAIDVVISDIVMPEMDGYSLCKALRADERLQHVPVILLTSLADPKDVIQGLESGANNFICKPYEPAALLARVQNVLANQEIRRSESSAMGITIFFAGQSFFITADRLQILDLLLSTYENAVCRNNELVRARDELRGLNEQLEARVAERTATLQAEVVERRRLQEREHHLNGLLRAIRDINQLIVREKDPALLLQQACERLVERRGYRAVWAALPVRRGQPAFVAHVGWGEAADRFSEELRQGSLPSCWGSARAAELGLAVIDRRVSCRACPLSAAYGHDQGCVVPLRHGARDFGTLGICLATGMEIDEDETALLLEVGDDLGLALSGIATEGARKEGEEKYRVLFESAGDAIFIADPETGIILDANRMAERLLGMSRQEIIGMNRAALHPTTGEYDRQLAAHAAAGRVTDTESIVVDRSGRHIPVRISATVLELGDKTVLQGIFRDVTERHRAEQERQNLEDQLRTSQKMEAIGSLAGGVAHDFNNLLSLILSYNGFAMDAIPKGDPIHDDLQEVKNAAERAVALTRQLLAFGRKQILQPEPLDLNRIAAGLEKMLRRILGEDIDFVQVLEPRLGLTLADAGQIEQVLMNLVVNARDAMPAGGKLTIETANVEVDAEYAARHVAANPGPYVQLTVTDTGCGMNEQTRERLFEPFFTTKEKGKGTGLGLSTVYGIVRQTGGNIWVYSEPGQGTTFKVYLPRAPATTTETTVKPPLLGGSHATGTETIVVVEDEEGLLKVARRALEAAGYTVVTAGEGEEALRLCAQHAGEIDLLVTDVVMPGMSGRALADALAKTRPTLKVLYMSGYTDNAIVHHGVLDAGTLFLGKPFTSATLTQKVREVLDEGIEYSAGQARVGESRM
jgi:PAS domain S-box-containing protein